MLYNPHSEVVCGTCECRDCKEAIDMVMKKKGGDKPKVVVPEIKLRTEDEWTAAASKIADGVIVISQNGELAGVPATQAPQDKRFHKNLSKIAPLAVKVMKVCPEAFGGLTFNGEKLGLEASALSH